MSRSNNMPDRDLEKALSAQLKVDASTVRLSRDPWDAVAPEMGSQRARRPWEVIADILNTFFDQVLAAGLLAGLLDR